MNYFVNMWNALWTKVKTTFSAKVITPIEQAKDTAETKLADGVEELERLPAVILNDAGEVVQSVVHLTKEEVAKIV